MTEDATLEVGDVTVGRKEIVGAGVTRYRVYKSSNDFVLVTASSAIEALRRSGMKSAHKIQLERPDLYVALPQKMLSDTQLEKARYVSQLVEGDVVNEDLKLNEEALGKLDLKETSAFEMFGVADLHGRKGVARRDGVKIIDLADMPFVEPPSEVAALPAAEEEKTEVVTPTAEVASAKDVSAETEEGVLSEAEVAALLEENSQG